MGEMYSSSRISGRLSEEGPTWNQRGHFAERPAVPAGLLQSHLAKADKRMPGTPKTAVNPVGLLRSKLPQEGWRTTAAVVDYFLSLLYPA